MREFKINGVIPFLNYRWAAIVFSAVLMLASIGAMAIRGINWGLDFTGGTLVEVGFSQPADREQIIKVLSSNGYADASVQLFGSSRDILIRLAPREEQAKGKEANEAINKISNEIISVLQTNVDANVEMRRIEFVGPTVGDELREQGGLALITALLCILAYVALRFEWRFAVGSVAALFHDVLITLGLFAALGLEFDLTILAAVLAVIGYSLNDTIVVFDRIRENFRILRDEDTVSNMNTSLTQTLSRTTITSGTTMLVLIALFIWGGEIIHGFATALLFGIFVGTYSSIFVASVIALLLGVSREDLIPVVVEKEGEEFDAQP